MVFLQLPWKGPCAAQAGRDTERRAFPLLEIRTGEVRTLRVWQRHAGRSLRAELQGADGADRLELRAESVRSKRFRVTVIGADGSQRTLPPPPARTFRGHLADRPDTQVAASWHAGRLKGLIRRPEGGLQGFEPTADLEHVVYDLEDLEPITAACGVPTAVFEAPVLPDGPEPETAAATSLHVGEIAFDADPAYYAANGSSVPAVVADIEDIVNGLNVIYERDVGIRYEITEILVRESVDPYSTTDPNELLSQFRSQWRSHHGDIPRDIAHLMTGRDLNSSVIGIAYVGVVCSTYSYGVSQSRFSGNYARRVALTAHELGHNWSAAHCNGQSDCSIMCASLGGCSGVLTGFGSVSIATIAGNRDSRSCLSIETQTEPPVTKDDVAWVSRDASVEIAVLDNDFDPDGHALDLHQVSSPLHGSVLVGTDDTVTYTPDGGYTGDDLFRYVLTDSIDGTATGTVFVTVYDPDLPDHHWPLDEGGGLTAADIVGGADGQLVNIQQTGWSAGASGSALAFDGTDDYVTVPTEGIAPLGATASLAFWIRTTQAGSDNASDAPGIAGVAAPSAEAIRWGFLDADGRIAIQVDRHSPAHSGVAVNDGAWHHVVLTRNHFSGQVSVYLDGVLQQQVAAPTGTVAAPITSLGRIEGTTGSPAHFEGLLDDLCLFRRVLPPVEVEALYGTVAWADADHDGLMDWLDEDDDNDGATDAEEVLAGTDPGDAASALVLELTEAGAGEPAAGFEAAAGRRYVIQHCLDLACGSWVEIGDAVIGAGAGTIVPLPQGAGFYRLAVERLP